MVVEKIEITCPPRYVQSSLHLTLIDHSGNPRGLRISFDENHRLVLSSEFNKEKIEAHVRAFNQVEIRIA